MCFATESKAKMSSTKKENTNCDERSAQNNVRAQSSQLRKRRGKRDREGVFQGAQKTPKKSTKKKSKALQKHGKDGKGGGLESMIPSLIGVVVLVVAVMAQRGFRGRASVAGIDLGTTNSVICVQSPSKGVGQIDCISDDNGSPIVPSVVAFLQPEERKIGPSSKTPSKLQPHPSHVLVGHAAKHRIDTHPHHTLYHAKRVLGRDSNDMSVKELQKEVEFRIDSDNDTVMFQVDQYHIPPHQVGSYIINHLMTLAKNFLGHENVKSAVLAVPAKFTAHQRQQTALAFTNAGVQVARILEEPTAAALAYGLHRKDGVEKILVYDFVSVATVLRNVAFRFFHLYSLRCVSIFEIHRAVAPWIFPFCTSAMDLSKSWAVMEMIDLEEQTLMEPWRSF
jgi:hypothetical protein